MKIMCQEHYDEVVRYAERIGDKTLEERLNDLKRWERNPNCPCEIELYKDSAPYSGGLVYHGTPDRSGCYCEPRIRGWEIHT